jgi:hypothetical protein
VDLSEFKQIIYGTDSGSVGQLLCDPSTVRKGFLIEADGTTKLHISLPFMNENAHRYADENANPYTNTHKRTNTDVKKLSRTHTHKRTFARKHKHT